MARLDFLKISEETLFDDIFIKYLDHPEKEKRLNYHLNYTITLNPSNKDLNQRLEYLSVQIPYVYDKMNSVKTEFTRKLLEQKLIDMLGEWEAIHTYIEARDKGLLNFSNV